MAEVTEIGNRMSEIGNRKVPKSEIALLQQMVEKLGLQKVAEAIGYNKSAICHVLKGTYRGKPDRILRAVSNKFSQQLVECPVLGKIPLTKCVEERNRPFTATNPVRVRLVKICKTCPNAEAHHANKVK